MRKTFCCAALLAVLAMSISQHWAMAQTPASQPAQPAFSLSPPRITQLKTITYLYLSESATYTTVGEVVTRRLRELNDIVKHAGIAMTGAPVVIYHGANFDPNSQFVLDIGLPVDDNTTAVGKAQVRTLGPVRSLTAVFVGPIHRIGRAYGRMYARLNDEGIAPTDEYREHYLYWESDDSPNNVVMIEIPLRD